MNTFSPPRPIRVLLIGPRFPLIGGTAMMFEQLLSELDEFSELSIRAMNTTKGRGKISALVWTVFAIAKMILLVPRVDLVSFHASIRRAQWFGPIVWLICRLFRRRWVFRGYGGCFDVMHEGLPDWRRKLLEKTTLSADYILFETRMQVDYFRPMFGEHCQWLANNRPIDSSAQNVEKEHRKDATVAPRFIFLGHVKPSKGARILIEATEKLSNITTVDLYGPLQDGMRATEFEGKTVHYAGVLEPHEVTKTVRQYDVLVLPTFYSGEGYPGAILEAYAAGIPVISTHWRAIPEIVDQDSGILIEPHSVDELADAMRLLAESPDVIERLRLGARKKNSLFASEIWTKKFIAILMDLASRSTLTSRFT